MPSALYDAWTTASTQQCVRDRERESERDGGRPWRGSFQRLPGSLDCRSFLLRRD